MAMMVVVVSGYDHHHHKDYIQHDMLLNTIIITMGLNIMVMQAMIIMINDGHNGILSSARFVSPGNTAPALESTVRSRWEFSF